MRSIKAGRSEWDSNEMCESPSAKAGTQALGPRFRGDDEKRRRTWDTYSAPIRCK